MNLNFYNILSSINIEIMSISSSHLRESTSRIYRKRLAPILSCLPQLKLWNHLNKSFCFTNQVCYQICDLKKLIFLKITSWTNPQSKWSVSCSSSFVYQNGIPQSGHKGVTGHLHFLPKRLLVQYGTQTIRAVAPTRPSKDIQIMQLQRANLTLKQKQSDEIFKN